jgi:uncharacterized membrane protein YhaH (DUF805 family)
MGYFDALMRYFEVWGRTSRSQYWTFQIIALLGSIAALFADVGAIRLGFEQAHFGLIVTFFGILNVIPAITATVRRLHDIGKSGFWYLLCFVPLGGLVVLFWMFRRGDDGDNDYGSPNDDPSREGDEMSSSGYEPPAGRVVRMGAGSARPAASDDSGGASTTRFI